MKLSLDLVNPRYYFKIIREIVTYTKTPFHNPRSIKGLSKWKYLIAIFLIGEVLSVIGVLPKALLEEYDIIEDLDNILSDYQATWPKWRLLLVGGFIAPLVEELAWRLHLKPSAATLSITLGTIGYYLSGLAISDESAYDLLGGYMPRVLTFIIVTIIFYAMFKLDSNWHLKIADFWKKRFKWIYWFVILTFALMHLGRYQNFGDWEHYVIIPLIIMPQIISGSIFGYVRMHFGFIYALGLHMLGNAYLMIIF